MQQWFDDRTDDAILRASVGNKPSLVDVIRLSRPKPQTAEREALFRYLLGRPYDATKLPALARQLEAFKRGDTTQVPDVPFELLTSSPLSR